MLQWQPMRARHLLSHMHAVYAMDDRDWLTSCA
jgi:hypothetical protein